MKRIAKEYSSHGAFHEKPNLFLIHAIYNTFLLPHQGQRHLPFVTDLSSGTSIERGVSFYSSMSFFTLHVQRFVSTEPTFVSRLEGLV